MSEYNLKHYAYLGDAVWELFIREICINSANSQKALHNFGIKFANAHFQAFALSELETLMTNEEKEIVRRGRNLKISISKKSNPQTHSLATALEVIIGYLYINNKARLEEIFEIVKKTLIQKPDGLKQEYN